MSRVNKAIFISALRRFAEIGGDDLYDPVYERVGYRPCRGEQALALGLAKYLDSPDIPGPRQDDRGHQDRDGMR